VEKIQCEIESFRLFAFGLGELVCLQQEVANDSHTGSRGSWLFETKKVKIISRMVSEDCTGSIQRIYGIRTFNRDGSSGVSWFQELELCAPPIITPEKESRSPAQPES
jgi:hypothetical protein